jgi:beta-lactam-binding protein with PASTA domain
MPWRRHVTQEEVVPGPRPRPLIWPWLVLLLLLVAALIGGVVWLANRDTRPRVPDVVGQSTSSAVRDVRSHGYVPDTQTRPGAGAEVGRVLSQDPEGGSRLKHGQRVTLVAARGVVSSGVPNVVGLAVDQAFVRLQSAGLKGRTKKVASTRLPDIVLAQSPAAETRAGKGSVVLLTLSNGGARQTAVPRVVGLTEAVATAKLSALGLQVRVLRIASTKPKGLVISQQPAQGTKAARGSVAGLTVSDGPPTTTSTTTTTTTTGTSTTPLTRGPTVPKVVGMGQAEAFTRLERAGFRVDSFPVASSRPRGLVVRQRPAGGTRAAPRSVVRLAVSIGSGPRPFRVVPDVSGMTETDAKRVLVRVGFTARALLPADDTTSQGDVVVDQKPSAGARVQAGSQVAIYLGPPQ